MHTSKNKKMVGILVAVGAIVLGIVGYMFLTRGDDQGLDGLTNTGSVPVVGRQVIALLSQLAAIKIDRDVIDSQAFQNLQDFSVPVLPEPIGRPNPFAPIGQ